MASAQAMAVEVAYHRDAAMERLPVNDNDVVVLDATCQSCRVTRSASKAWDGSCASAGAGPVRWIDTPATRGRNSLIGPESRVSRQRMPTYPSANVTRYRDGATAAV
jgi:hypothetical protein